MEPRTATPRAKRRAIRELSTVGVPIRVMIAPIVPGLNDHELPQIMQAVKEAGAKGAGYVMLRLPLAVSPLFLDWLRTHRPLQAEKVEGLIRYVSKWGERMRGSGAYAEGIDANFDLFAKKFGLDKPWMPLDCSQFTPPKLPGGQLRLFT
jgi:DNA repair photolyase